MMTKGFFSVDINLFRLQYCIKNTFFLFHIRNILGYSDTYSVLVRGDVILYAVYDEPDAVIERTPVIAITDVYTTVDDGVDKISFVATRNVPKGYTLREHGVLGGTDPEFGGTDGSSKLILDGGDNVLKATSSDSSSNGAYVFTWPIEDRDMTVYLRGYMIVTNTTTGQDETIYTDIFQGSFEDLQ